MQWVQLVIKVIATFLGLYKQYETVKQEPNKPITEDSLKETFGELFEVVAGVQQALGKTDITSNSVIKDIFSNVMANGELTPVGKIVMEALEDGVITKKEMYKIVLAYNLYSGDVKLDDIKASQTLAEAAGYKRPVNLAQQVENTLNKLIGQ